MRFATACSLDCCLVKVKAEFFSIIVSLTCKFWQIICNLVVEQTAKARMCVSQWQSTCLAGLRPEFHLHCEGRYTCICVPNILIKKYIAPNEILTLLLQCPVTNDFFALHRGPVLVPQYCLQKAVAF